MTSTAQQTEFSPSPTSADLFYVPKEAFEDEAVRSYLCDMIAPAVWHSDGKFSPEHVVDQCAKGHMQMWLAVREDDASTDYLAALVTELVDYPGRKVLSIPFLAGSEMASWLHLYPQIEDWAKEQGCGEVEIIGRKGWERVAGPLGFAYSYTTLAKEI